MKNTEVLYFLIEEHYGHNNSRHHGQIPILVIATKVV